MPGNVKDFGAAGNGVSDGTAAINAAISIAASQNGGVGIATIAAGLVSRSSPRRVQNAEPRLVVPRLGLGHRARRPRQELARRHR
jgi:hypothetical protein